MDEEKAPVKSAKSVENKTPEKEIAENVAAKEKAENETEEQVAEKENSGPEIEQKESALNVGEEKENDEKENDEIDIYLFSNGQRYSPPRKYHLRTDDLKQWKATLCILARKQYGSLHSAVELYELDGKKVEDSKYIRDCAVYVAVVPPDQFLYAGYDKYLIKASKSFERRLSKKTNGATEESSKSDDIRSKLSQDVTHAPEPVKDNELRAQYPSTRKNNEVRKSLQKNLYPKHADKIKPVANQVSQRLNFPRKLNFKSDSVAKKTAINKKENPSWSPTFNTTLEVPGNVSLIDHSTEKRKTRHIPELYVCDHNSHNVNESLSSLENYNHIINKNKQGSTTNNRQISKPIYKNNKTKADTYLDTKAARVYAVNNKRIDYLKSPKLKINTPVQKNIRKRSAENEDLNTNAKSPVASNLGDPEITNKASTDVQMQGFPCNQMTALTNTRALMVDMRNLTLKERTAINEVNLHVSDVEQLQKNYSGIESNVTQQTNKNLTSVSTELESEMSATEKNTKLDYKQIPDIAKEFEERAILIKSRTANCVGKLDAIEQTANEHKTLFTNKSSKDTDNLDKFSQYVLLPQTKIISKDKPIPGSRYLETMHLKGIKNYNTKNKLLTNVNKLNKHDVQTAKNSYDLNVPILFPIHDKPNKFVYNSVNSEPAASKEEIVSDESNDITLKTVNTDASKIHSYTFIIRKDDANNTIKPTVVKAVSKETQKSIQVPITSMVKDEDIVHIDVYRNDFHESMPMEDNAAKTSYGEKQIKQTKYIYVTDTIKKTYGEDKTEAGNSDKVSLKDVEIKETFMNPNWKRNSYDPLSTVSVEPVTQFVHRGDSVNLNMSMEIRNAEGILKSNQGMNIGNSNNQGITIENLNITQSDNDEDDSSKSPNELTQSKSFQSIEDDTPHLCCRKDKVVVYQCACCNRSGAETSNNFTAKPLFHGQGFYFLLPVAIPAQDSTKAPCQTCDKQVQHTESLIKTNLNISNKETIISVPGDGDKPSSVKLSNTSQNIKFEKIVVDSSTKHQVGNIDKEVDHSRMIMMGTEPSQTSSRCNIECKQQQTSLINQHQFTQTDWADVLLEARAEQDGHFTFYLPPLQVLQKYTFR